MTVSKSKVIRKSKDHLYGRVQAKLNHCGANLENISDNKQFDKKPSESTIEVKAEEIK